MSNKAMALRVLLWCIRLTYSGMPLGYVRYLMLKKHEEVKNAEDDTLAKEFP